MKYSQNNEETVILDYFDGYIGTFLDIGANDGETLSNSRKLALMGWQGVCIEPSMSAYRKLHDLYLKDENVLTIKLAVGEMDGMTVLHDSGEHLGKGDTSLLSTLVSRETHKWKGTEFKDQIVKVARWETVVKEYDLNDFDFITIDAEGMDIAILHQIDLTNTSLVCVEHNGSQTAQMRIKQYCAKFGLTDILLVNGENIICGKSTRFSSK